MFSDLYNIYSKEVDQALQGTQPPSPNELEMLLEKSISSRLSLPEITTLLKISDIKDNHEYLNMISTFLFNHFRGSKKSISVIAPLYLSNYCIDRCAYCCFRKDNQDIKRHRVHINDLARELQNIANDGCRTVEYTLATDTEFTPQKLAQYIQKGKEIIGPESTMMLCSDHMGMQDYAFLKDAGLSYMIQWDETLHQETFKSFHKSSPRKGNWKERVNNHDRALSAELDVAVGILFGLHKNWKFDLLMLMQKTKYLEQTYGRLPAIFGTPRIKATDKVKNVKLCVTDQDYSLALSVMKICFPSIPRWLQTRETPEFNFAHILDGDVYTYRCGEVRPGGYETQPDAGGQFHVKEMTKNDFIKNMNNLGFRAKFRFEAT